tara:strand:- start:84 stop:326 length:243 start_codon:yes stop_codon:yes gene_type:complete
MKERDQEAIKIPEFQTALRGVAITSQGIKVAVYDKTECLELVSGDTSFGVEIELFGEIVNRYIDDWDDMYLPIFIEGEEH